MTTSPAQTAALRLALSSMLTDLAYPEPEKHRLYVAERLDEAGWTDEQRQALATLALRWAQTQKGGVADALRQAMHGTPRDVPGSGEGSQGQAYLTRLKERLAMASIANTLENGTTSMAATDVVYGLDTQALHELNIIRDQMQTPTFAKRLPDAYDAVRAGRVREATAAEAPILPAWVVLGREQAPERGKPYLVSKDLLCNCAWQEAHPSQKYGCYHTVSVEMFKRLHAVLSPRLPLPPTTPDERLAQPPVLASQEPQEAIQEADGFWDAPEPDDAPTDLPAASTAADAVPDWRVQLEAQLALLTRKAAVLEEALARAPVPESYARWQDGIEEQLADHEARLDGPQTSVDLTPTPLPGGGERSRTCGQLYAALAQAQAAMKNPRLDSKGQVGNIKTRFASTPAIRDVVVPALAAQHVTILQYAYETDIGIRCVTSLGHASGEYWLVPTDVPKAVIERESIADRGKAIGFAKRWALQTTVVLFGDDEDEGMEDDRPPQQRPRQASPPPAPDMPADPKRAIWDLLRTLGVQASTREQVAQAVHERTGYPLVDEHYPAILAALQKQVGA